MGASAFEHPQTPDYSELNAGKFSPTEEELAKMSEEERAAFEAKMKNATQRLRDKQGDEAIESLKKSIEKGIQ